MEAVLDLRHLLLPFRRQPVVGGRPAQHQGHAGTVVDLDPHRTGHTVSAAPAEIPGELLLVLRDQLLDFRCHGWRIVDVGEKFLQLRLPLHAPDGQHIVKLRLEGVCRPAVVDQTAGESLHGDETHIVLSAHIHNLDILLGSQVAEGELHGLIEPRLDGLLRHRQPMVGNADVPDLPLLFRLDHGLVEPGPISWFRAEGGIVELIDIDVIRPQIL